MSAYAYTKQTNTTVTETDNRVLEDVDGPITDYRLGDIGADAEVNITAPDAFKLADTALQSSERNLGSLLKFTGETLNTNNRELVKLATNSTTRALETAAESGQSDGRAAVKSIVMVVGIIAAVVGFVIYAGRK